MTRFWFIFYVGMLKLVHYWHQSAQDFASLDAAVASITVPKQHPPRPVPSTPQRCLVQSSVINRLG